MKKLFFAVLLVTAFALPSMAAALSGTDMLMWSIDLEESDQFSSGSYPEFNKVTIGLRNGSDYIDLNPNTYYIDGGSLVGPNGPANVDAIDSELGMAGDFATKLGSLENYTAGAYEGYEVVIQLWNNDNLVAFSDNTFDSSKHIYLSSLERMTLPSDSNPSAFAALVPINLDSRVVPEPTCGLLMMLGAGLLALRRRRRA